MKLSGSSSNTGIYHIRYEISFEGQHLRGDVPEIYVASASSFAYYGLSTASFTNGGSDASLYQYKIKGNSKGYGAGDTHTYVGPLDETCTASASSTSCSYVTAIEGNQPAGTFVLNYECESRTAALDSAYVVSGSKKANLMVRLGNWTVREGDYLRVEDSYYQIEAVEYERETNYNVTVTLDMAYQSTTGTYTNAEVGYFYSDPDATSGVSTYCLANRITASSQISVDATASTLSAEIRSIDTIASDSTALTIVRYRHNTTSTKVGYYWDVTFNQQPGDLNPLTCTTKGYYSKTNVYDGKKYCNVTTIQDGTLIDGYFQLGTTYPHEYVHYPVDYNSTYIRKDVEGTALATLLEGVVSICNQTEKSYNSKTFEDHTDPRSGTPTIYNWDDCVDDEKVWGELTIERNSYTPSSDTRWSGGYAWTITFTTRPGNVPQMRSSMELMHDIRTATSRPSLPFYSSLGVTFDKEGITAASSVATSLEVADEKGTSGVDIYQGADNYFKFSVDEPTTPARDGNQIFGKFGLSFDGVSSATSAFSVQPLGTTGTDGRRSYNRNVSYEAMSAQTFKQIFENELFKGKDIVDVSRSKTYTQAMGYTYTVFFRHADVGENIDLVTSNTELLDGDDATVVVTELVAGAQVYGSFQLTFDGYTTGAMAYNVEADAMEDMINALPSVSPSAVAVTRSGPMKTGPAYRDGNQVGGYIWSITFMSNTWADPTIDHNEDYTPGNWVGEAVSYDAVWATGTSKSWGKNVGNMPEMTCLDGGLYTSNGQMPTDGCTVAEETMGTEPLGGFFRIALDTNYHLVINQQDTYQSGYIRHNAVATH
jgi:hypothetical protein